MGRPLEAVADPGSYLAIRRVWKDGDTISVSLPMTLRTEALAGDDTVAAAMYGPLVLAADLGAGPVDGPSKIIPDRSTVPKWSAEAGCIAEGGGVGLGEGGFSRGVEVQGDGREWESGCAADVRGEGPEVCGVLADGGWEETELRLASSLGRRMSECGF